MSERLPVRVMKALELPRQEILVLRATQRDARTALDDDARALHPDFAAVYQVKSATMRILFANGSQIRYYGGTRDQLDQRVRGLDVDFIDGEVLIDPRAVAVILRRS